MLVFIAIHGGLLTMMAVAPSETRRLPDNCCEQGWVLKNSPAGRSFDLG